MSVQNIDIFTELHFYDTLKEIFIGIEIEDQSGFQNLRVIKNEYIENVIEKIKREITKKIENEDCNPELLFKQLYIFLKNKLFCGF